jgi:dTDP-4-dehydrorhamnose 3,5-epimerase
MNTKEDFWKIQNIAKEVGFYESIDNTPVKVIPRTINADNRGEFSRLLDIESIKDNIAEFKNGVAQASISKSHATGTLRGIHVQSKPSIESKIITVISGSIIDYVVDLRKSSTTYLKKFQFEICSNDPVALLIPAGFGHGIYTLEENTIIFYAMNTSYVPYRDLSINFQDTIFNFKLPGKVFSISEKDKNALLLRNIEEKFQIG